MENLGKNIRLLRVQRKMSQDQLAESLHVTRQTGRPTSGVCGGWWPVQWWRPCWVFWRPPVWRGDGS